MKKWSILKKVLTLLLSIYAWFIKLVKIFFWNCNKTLKLYDLYLIVSFVFYKYTSTYIFDLVFL